MQRVYFHRAVGLSVSGQTFTRDASSHRRKTVKNHNACTFFHGIGEIENNRTDSPGSLMYNKSITNNSPIGETGNTFLLSVGKQTWVF